MRVEFVDAANASADLEQASFRVLLWNRPQQERAGWALDEWDVEDAKDVLEVIEWAEAQGATTYEVGVRWPYSRLDAEGNLVVQFRFMRVAGEPGGDHATTRIEVFHPLG